MAVNGLKFGKGRQGAGAEQTYYEKHPELFYFEMREAMGLLQRIFGRNRDEKRLMIQGGNWQPSDYLPPTIGIFNSGGRSDAGVPVDEYTALTASAVYACVAVIANTMGTLPLHVQAKGSRKRSSTIHYITCCMTRPNEFMTSVVFRETMMLKPTLMGTLQRVY